MKNGSGVYLGTIYLEGRDILPGFLSERLFASLETYRSDFFPEWEGDPNFATILVTDEN